MKIAWTTDIHIDHLEAASKLDGYLASMRSHAPQLIISTGDHAEHSNVKHVLDYIQEKMQIPVLFVFGNHDFYGSSINETRRLGRQISYEREDLVWLNTQYYPATPQTVIVGVDGWYDGGYGNYWGSGVSLSDFTRVYDFSGKSKEDIFHLMKNLALESVYELEYKLYEIGNHYKNVIVATHVPPFEEACFYAGNRTDQFYLPLFSSKYMGDLLREASNKHPNVNYTVLCGHTHHYAEVQMADNLLVKVGSAVYGNPAYTMLDIE